MRNVIVFNQNCGVIAQKPDSKGKWDAVCTFHLQVAQLQRHVALSNPLLDFDKLLLVKRSVKSPRLGLPQNWQSNCVLPTSGFDDEIAVLSKFGNKGELSTLFRPSGTHFVGDVDLHFDGDRMLFSSVAENSTWQVFEVRTDGSGLRRVTPMLRDIHNYDACYLPDGAIIFSSTASIAAVPCVNGSTRVANFYRMEPDGAIRQLCFDQEHNWCPTMLESGRVLYLRWEYTDTPHAHDRVLFSMNPDGTSQMEFYGSNSYWPNSLFYARPVPGHSSMFVGIVGGHHGVPRMGELVLFDVGHGRRESAGTIQRIPGNGKPVQSTTDPRFESSLIQDQLVDASWPKFLHPYPLSEKYFLTACQPTPKSLWGVYLADVFGNLTLVKETPGYALLEPLPLRTTPKPPVIPSKVDLNRKDAVVYLSDIYAGDGLKDIPRGTVKELRLISYHYLFPGMGGPQGVVRHGRTLGYQADRWHGPRRAGRFSRLSHPSQHPHRGPAVGCRRQGPSTHAKLVHRNAGRSAFVCRLPRKTRVALRCHSTRWQASESHVKSSPGMDRQGASTLKGKCSRFLTGTASDAMKGRPHRIARWPSTCEGLS